MKMVTKLLGVKHYIEDADSAIAEPLKELRRGQTVALEITPKELAFFEKIHKLKRREKIQKMVELETEFTQEIFERIEKEGVKISDATKSRIVEDVSMRLVFFNCLFDTFKARGAKFVSLESEIAKKKMAFLSASQIFLKRELSKQIRDIKLQWLLSSPSRDLFIVKRIMKTKPDFAIMGKAHLNGVHKNLSKEGHSNKIVFRQKLHGKERLAETHLRLFMYFVKASYRKRKTKKIKARKKNLRRK